METGTWIVSSTDRLVACPLVLTKRKKILSGPADVDKLFYNRLLSSFPPLPCPRSMLNVFFPPFCFLLFLCSRDSVSRVTAARHEGQAGQSLCFVLISRGNM